MADYVEYDSAGTLGEEYNERVEKNSDESEDRPKVLVKKRKGKQEEREKLKLSEIEKFLELYELYHCLWDYKVDEYKDRNAKEHALEEIVRGMEKREFTVKKAKDKIRVLRNTYSNELTKIYKSKVSGAGLDDVYVPTLRWFSTIDRIIGGVVQSRGSQSVGLFQEQSSTQVQQDDADKDEETIFEDVQDIPSSSIPSTSSGRIIREKPSSASKQIPYAKPISRKVAGERLGKIQNSVQQLKDISDKVLAPERIKDMCEYELFGQFIASQLKKLPEINALAVMQKIQTCLMNERMTIARGNSMSHYQWEDTLTTSSSMVSPNQED
ncbi:uncharacterized protein LOC124370570 [Homalodisca vitripennis]|uniref:uncharacterized protein LOC124370570 n=1 Tax=Homalodisca vitripennis TaxID=197043 RepID=UPI001EEC70B1|nr:uncharacterized protein LOC124370570 [Homalodisca vitripennis]